MLIINIYKMRTEQSPMLKKGKLNLLIKINSLQILSPMLFQKNLIKFTLQQIYISKLVKIQIHFQYWKEIHSSILLINTLSKSMRSLLQDQFTLLSQQLLTLELIKILPLLQIQSMIQIKERELQIISQR